MIGTAPATCGLVEMAVEPRATTRTAAFARRVVFVDASRGIAVIAMLVANLVNVCLRDVPSALAHNQGDTLRAFDLPAPVFQLLVGVSLPLFVAQRRRLGRSPRTATVEATRRFALLVLLGMVLDGIGRLSLVPSWGVLQTLGLGGIVATALLAWAPGWRLAVAGALLACYSGAANGMVHARPDAALAFVPLTIVGTIIGDAVAGGAPSEHVAGLGVRTGALALATALALHAEGVPFNKLVGSSSFVAFAAATGLAVVAIGAAWESSGRAFPRWLLAIGRNALTTWVLLNVLVYYPAWLVFPSWDRLALAPGLASVAVVTTVLCATTLALARRGIRVSL
jgi:predicted acyltransferase